MRNLKPSVHDDLIGKTVRGIKILGYGPHTKAFKRSYKAECHCGHIFYPTSANFKENKTKQCVKCAKRNQVTTGVSLMGWQGRLWSTLMRKHKAGLITMSEPWLDLKTFCSEISKPTPKHLLAILDTTKPVDINNIAWNCGGYRAFKLDCYHEGVKTTYENVMEASRGTGVNHMSIRTKLWKNGISVVKKHLFVPAGQPISQAKIEEELVKAKRAFRGRKKKSNG